MVNALRWEVIIRKNYAEGPANCQHMYQPIQQSGSINLYPTQSSN